MNKLSESELIDQNKPIKSSVLPVGTHDEMVARWMEDPEFVVELERLECEEMALLDAQLKAKALNKK